MNNAVSQYHCSSFSLLFNSLGMCNEGCYPIPLRVKDWGICFVASPWSTMWVHCLHFHNMEMVLFAPC